MNTFLSFHNKTANRFVVLVVVCLYWLPSQGQQSKGPLQLADQYFAAGEYYTAANLYEQFLHPPKKQRPQGSQFPINAKRRRIVAPAGKVSRTDILYKQAESYRLANYWTNAADLYKEIAEKNAGQYPDAWYWYAVCERSLQQYDSAEISLNQYIKTGNSNAQYATEAEKELQTIRFIRQQLARPDSVLVKTKKLVIPGSEDKGAYAPAQVNGNRFLVSSTQSDSVQVNGVNPNHSRLYYATINNGVVEELTPVGLPVAAPNSNQGAASVSANGRFLYFSQWKKENGNTVSSIWYAERKGEEWGAPVLLPSVNRSGYNSKQPFCSSDGNYLFFASDCPGGAGNFDIWYAPLNSDGTTGKPVNAGAMINTAKDEQTPFYHTSSGTLVFASNGRLGMGGYDLFAAKGNETDWKQPENLGHPVNSSRDDIYFFAPENTSLLSNAVFSSDRGTGCCLETWSIAKAPKSKRLSGRVIDCKDNKPVDSAMVTLKDVNGKTRQVLTDADGNYLFDPITDADVSVTVSRELYKDTLTSVRVQKTDESDLLIDQLINTDICLARKLVIRPENVVTVFFDFDKYNLKPEAVSKLDSIYNMLQEMPAATIQISGYTDGLGSDEYNKVLSDRRARACADYLIGKGIDTGRITFESFGACCPVEMELINGRDNAEGRSRNRRALINITKE